MLDVSEGARVLVTGRVVTHGGEDEDEEASLELVSLARLDTLDFILVGGNVGVSWRLSNIIRSDTGEACPEGGSFGEGKPTLPLRGLSSRCGMPRLGDAEVRER